MTYQDFKENTRRIIQNRLGSGARVMLQEVVKNNNTRYDGLTILTGGSNVSPTIYLNYYYRQYLSGKSLDEIYREILNIYEEKPYSRMDVSFFTDYGQAKRRIVFRLVNYERNRPLLEKVPHVRFLDLAIVFHCLVELTDCQCATVLIYNHHLAFWGVTRDALYALALENTPRLLSYELRDMSDVLAALVKDTAPETKPEKPFPMYVLTNQSRLNGSGCILYKDLLKNVSAKLGDDLYVIPSSVHEVLLLPVTSGNSPDDFTGMIQEVNATQLSREEVLSDHVYLYSAKTGELTIPLY